MAPSGKPASSRGQIRTGSLPRANPAAIGVAAWLVPGAGHFLVGQTRKGAIFFVVLIAMFVIGLAFDGRLFPFQMSEPLVFLAAAAEWAIGVAADRSPRCSARAPATSSSITYEYGNTFLIVSGLLNALVMLDAVDYAQGRKDAMTTHLGVMMLFAACVSTVFGTLLRDDPARSDAARRPASSRAWSSGAYALGWVMYFAFG